MTRSQVPAISPGRAEHGPVPGAGYAWGICSVAAAVGFSALLARHLQLSDLVMITLLPVVGIATRFGIGPSLLTAVLSALCFDFFFIPPVMAFAPSDLKSAVTLVVMMVVAGVTHGLAELTRRQERAARAREVALEAERMRGSLLSAVSHDLRTPLAAIFGAGTELLQDGSQLNAAEHRELLQSIVEEAARLDRLVTNLLDVARSDAVATRVRKRREPFDEVIEAALGRLKGRLGQRSVRSHVPQAVPMVPMDAVLIQQVLVNLLENAIRYSQEGSPLEIEVSEAPSHAVVEIRDRGPGIQSDEAERLFERFYRGAAHSSRDGGMGLGLAICRAIVQAHGGSIGLLNRNDGGAIARFTLPLGRGESSA